MSGRSTFEAVIFDVGGVLADPGDGEFPDDFFGGRDADSDHPWHRWERGELKIAEALLLLDLPPGRPRPPKPYVIDEDYLELAEQLAEAGVRLALCTNTPLETSPLWQALYPWGEIFEVIVRSCDVGARKPDERMVQAALTQLGLEPHEALFVDDLPANRASANAMGVTTVDGGRPEGIDEIRALTGLRSDAPRRDVGYRGPQRPRVENRGDQLLSDVLFTPEHKENPYPLFAELRNISPLHQLSGKPVYYATGYDDCQQVLRHGDFNKSIEYMAVDTVTGEAVPPPPATMALPIAFMDPPDHARVRGLMNGAFSKRRLDNWRPQLDSLAARLVNDAVERGRNGQAIDVVEAISFPMAQQVICDMVGVPIDDRDDFRHLMSAAAVVFEPGLTPERSYEAVIGVLEMTDYLTQLGASTDGLLADLLAEAEQTGTVTAEEVIANITFMFFAGFETVAHLISVCLYLMSEHPDQYAALVESPDLSTAAAIEASRYHSPVQTNSRATKCDLDIGGVNVPAGNIVVTMLGAANRDPLKFDDPDRFDINRTGPAPLSFGAGIHYCLGAQLATYEVSLVLEHLVAAGVTSIRTEKAEWKQAIVLRGFEHLALSFDGPTL